MLNSSGGLWLSAYCLVVTGFGVWNASGDVLALCIEWLSYEKGLKSELVSMMCLRAGLDSSELDDQGGLSAYRFESGSSSSI